MVKLTLKWRVFFVGVCLLSFVSTEAVLRMELTQGASKRIPIAWQPFAQTASSDQVAIQAKSLSTVLRSDLQYSGEFECVAKDPLKGPLDYWLNGSVEPTAEGGVLHLKLWQVLDESLAADIEKHKPFWSLSVVYQDSDDMQDLGHRISDAVYKAITGHRGNFSTRLAYVLVKEESGKRIYALQVSDADGKRPHEILSSPEPIMSPAWSADGKQLAYVSFESLHPGIYIQDLSSGRRRLVAQFEGVNGAPAFSPKGDQLALVLSKKQTPHIFLLDLQNGALRQLTQGWSLDTEPHWHPSGRSLLFTSNRGGSPQIYEVALQSGDVKRLSYQGRYNAHASVDATGRFMIYLHKDEDGFSIARQAYPDGRVKKLLSLGQSQSPSLAPNGRMVLYTAPNHGKRTLFMVSSSGKVRMRLPTPDGEVQSPAWSPYLTKQEE